MDSLLPSNATPLMKAVSKVNGDRRPLDVSVIRKVWCPYGCPEHLLPYLAAALSVDIWRDDWPLVKKRRVVDNAIRHHRHKGTLAGIREHMELVDVPLLKAYVPPLKFFPDPKMTKGEREAYLARFRQLRIYPYHNRGTAYFGAYQNSGYRLSGLFASGMFFPARTDAAARIGRRATVYDPQTDAEEPVTRAERVRVNGVYESTDFEEYFLRGEVGPALIPGGKVRAQYFSYDMGAEGRVYQTRVNRTYEASRDEIHLTTVRPSADPIDVRPEMVRSRSVVVSGSLYPSARHPAGFIVRGLSADKTFLPASTAYQRIYDVLYLHDPDRLPDKRGARTFVGHVRLGMPPYHAEIVGDIKRKKPKKAFCQFVYGYLCGLKHDRLDEAAYSIRVSKSLRDKVLFTSKTSRPITAGDRLRVGEASVGGWITDY